MYDPKPKPVFSINPQIIMTMNDEMARQIVEFFDSIVEERKVIPPAIYAFKQTLQKDLAANTEN